MSGICGIANFDGARVEPGTLRGMATAARHRGPDGIRYWEQENAGLANLAMNITPESLRERQPLVNERGDLVLTADARVDNREELISALVSKGHLRSKEPTDADLILAAYECWGESCPAHMVGDFAFAIWDRVGKRLFAARDTVGARSFYYRFEPRRVLFATEIKQILAAPAIPVRICEPTVAVSLVGQGGSEGQTFYEGIAQLPPGYALMIDAEVSRAWRYWDIDPDNFIEYPTEDQYAEHFREIFLEAVRCRLRSVKPVGIYLSGGLDSGSVASAAGWLSEQEGLNFPPVFHPYCWAFDRFTQSDERRVSDGIVRHFGFPVTYVPADEAWPLKDYPAHGPDRDDPSIAAFQVLHEYTLARARSEGMGMMLTGAFGDLAVGLDLWEYLDQLRTGQWKSLWGDLRAHSRLHGIPMRKAAKLSMWRPYREVLWPPGKAEWLRWSYYRLWRRSDPPRLYPEWVRPDFARRVGLEDLLRESQPPLDIKGLSRRRRHMEIFRSDHAKGLLWGDRLRSRFGMYEADPFTDRRVLSFVLSVPPSILNHRGERKRLLRQAMRGVMPEEVRRTAAKFLPGPLFYEGVRDRAVDTVRELINGSRAGALGYIDERALAEEYESFVRSEHRNTTFYFALMLEMWLRRYWV